METYQLKKIIIIVLLLVNLSLLGLLGQSILQERSARQQMLTQLKDLYLSSGIELALENLPASDRQTVATVQRSAAAEKQFAEAFLGTTAAQESGSAMEYSSSLGTMRLRRNSAFELTMTEPTISEKDCLSRLEPFGYTAFLHRSPDGSTVTLTQTLSGEPVLGATISLYFSDGFLSFAAGCYITDLQVGEPDSSFSAADALAAFLQQSLAQGIALSRVSGVYSAHQLSTETLFQSTLQPAWVIETNAGVYYVNQSNRELTLLQPSLS